MDKSLPTRFTRRRLAALLCGAPLLCGCFGYRFGAESLYPPEIRTVHVPVFRSTSYRRHLGERLTEAVVKEIERTTPFKVVAEEDADSTLSGALVSEAKRLVLESPTDEGRELEVLFTVEVTWTTRGGDLLRRSEVQMAPDVATAIQSAAFIPEGGQSLSVAQQQALQKIARQVVNLMETPW